jgi:hypothetical protein
VRLLLRDRSPTPPLVLMLRRRRLSISFLFALFSEEVLRRGGANMAEEGGVDGVVDVVELESYFFIFRAAASILFEFDVRICWLTEKRGR